MADLAASIIGIVSAGAKVALVLTQVANDLGSAGKEARTIAKEIRWSCTILTTLESTLKLVQDSPYYAHCSELTTEMMNVNLEMLAEVMEVIDGLSSFTDKVAGKSKPLRRVQWVFSKPKIVMLRAALDASRSNLDLMLGTLEVAQKATRQISAIPTMDAIAEDEEDCLRLESLQLAQQASMVRLQNIDPDLYSVPNMEDTNVQDLSGLADANTDSAVLVPIPSVTIDVTGLRAEIGSLRSTSSSIYTDLESIRSSVSERSNRISGLLAEDQARISQRWSQTLPESRVSMYQEFNANPFATPLGRPNENLRRTDIIDGLVWYEHTIARNFCKWMRSLDNTRQSEILRQLPHRLDRSRRKPRPSPIIPSIITNFRWEEGEWNHWPILVSSVHPEISNNPAIEVGHDTAPQALPASNLVDILPMDSNIGSTGMVVERRPQVCTLNGHHTRAGSKHTVLTPEKARVDTIKSLSSPRPSRSPITPLPIDYPPPQIALPADEETITWTQEAIAGAKMHRNTENEKDATRSGLTIDLSHRNIRNLPQKAVDLLYAEVDRLAISHNRINSLPVNFSRYNSLRYLNFRYNRLKEIPWPVLALESLEILDVGRNKIETLPDAISNLKSLKVLAISQNKIQRLPRSLSLMDSLQLLRVGENPLVYPPTDICFLKRSSNALSEMEVAAINVARKEKVVPGRGLITRASDFAELDLNECDAVTTSRIKNFLCQQPEKIGRPGSLL